MPCHRVLPALAFVGASLIGASLLTASNARGQTPTLNFATVSATKPAASEAATTALGVPIPTALRNGVFQITLSRAATAATIVQYTIGGSATAGTDYTALSGNATIPAGQSSTTISVAPLGDAQPERDETVVVTITGGTGYAVPIGGGIATVTIFDDDQLIQISAPDNQAAEPGANTGSIRLERMGSITNRLALPLLYQGNATNGVDVVTLPDSAIFPAGESIVMFTITPKADNDAEGQESLRVLVSGAPMQPASGATVNVADAVVTLTTNIPSVAETAGATANLIVTRSGDLTSSATVTLTTSGSATRNVDYSGLPNTVTFAAGAATVTLPIVILADQTNEGAETIVVTASTGGTLALGQPGSATLVIDEAAIIVVSSLTLSNNSIIGGGAITATVQLNAPAPPAGLPIALALGPAGTTTASLSSPLLQVAAGQQTGTFTITTVPVAANTTQTVSATPPGGAGAVSRNFIVSAPLVASVVLSRTSVKPQTLNDSTSVSGTITLTGAAPAAGMTFPLSSSDPALSTSPSVTVAAGQTTGNIRVTVRPVAVVTSATLTSTPGRSASITINPPAAASVVIAPSSIVGQTDGRPLANATITLDAASPASGISASLSGTRLSPTATTLSIAGGATSGQTGVTAVPVNAVTTGTLSASVGGATASGTLTINPPAVMGFSVTPDSVLGGPGVFNGSVRLESPAAAGFALTPTISNPAAFLCDRGNPIASIVATGGESNVPFSICTRSVGSRTTVSVSLGGSQRSLTVLPSARIAMSHTSVVGGVNRSPQELTASVILAQPQSQSIPLTITTSSSTLRVSQSTVTIPAGATTVVISVLTSSVATNRNESITVTGGSISATGNVQVRAPAVSGIALGNILPSGTTVNANFTLDGPAPVGYTAQIASNSALLTVPPTVGIPQDSINANFQLQVAASSSDAPVTITVTTPGGSRSFSATVRGVAAIQSLSVTPTSLVATDTAVGTLTLTAAAPTGGVSVPLSVLNPNAPAQLIIPASVTVPAGQTSTTFTVRTPFYVGNAFGATIRAGVLPLVRDATPIGIQGLNATPTFPSTVIGGAIAQGQLVIQRPAPAGGYTVSIGSASSLVSPPSSATIAQGQTSVAVNIPTSVVTTNQSATLQFTVSGHTVSRTLQLQARTLTMTASPQLVAGGSPITIGLSSNAPAGASGDVIQLSAPAGAPVTLPSSVTLPPGASSTSFVISTTAVTASTIVPITATLGGNLAASVNVTVQSPP